jgi:uncharacterized protein YfaP (DUF2135 family)
VEIRFRREMIDEIHRSPGTEVLLMRAAAPIAAGIAAATPVDTGETRASTRVEGGHRSADGRSVAARIVQGGASVPQQFGNAHEPTPARQFDRGRGA